MGFHHQPVASCPAGSPAGGPGRSPWLGQCTSVHPSWNTWSPGSIWGQLMWAKPVSDSSSSLWAIRGDELCCPRLLGKDIFPLSTQGLSFPGSLGMPGAALELSRRSLVALYSSCLSCPLSLTRNKSRSRRETHLKCPSSLLRGKRKIGIISHVSRWKCEA